MFWRRAISAYIIEKIVVEVAKFWWEMAALHLYNLFPPPIIHSYGWTYDNQLAAVKGMFQVSFLDYIHLYIAMDLQDSR